MLEWQEYIARILSEESCFDGISLSLSNDEDEIGVPPIIKASILMLEKMQKNQGHLNILVFPERIQSIFIFTLVKLLYNIFEGKIERIYNPEAFVPGERLRLGKAVVEFLGVSEENGKKRLSLHLADVDKYSAPVEYLPLMQRTNAAKLSTNKKFVEEKRIAKSRQVGLSANDQFLKLLSDYKTHMDSSIVNMTSIINTKELVSECRLCGEHIKDIVLFGQTDFEGNVKNIGAGQLGGIPAIVLASDLYAISALEQKKHPIQSVIIDGSNANSLLSQLDALDELIRSGVPITCVTDVVSSFDLQPFLERGFNIWRWDETSITEQLYDKSPLVADQKIKHCVKRKVDYCTTDGKEISTAIRLLYSHRREAQNASAGILKLFDKLFSLAFIALRETVPFKEKEQMLMRASLEECGGLLSQEKAFLSDATYSDYKTIIDCLKKVSSSAFMLPKNEAMANKLRSEHFQRVAIIVPDRTDKRRVHLYWDCWCLGKGLETEFEVFYPAEYYNVPCDAFDATFVVGWLKRAIMRKILYSFNTSFYIVFIYDYEKRWKNYDVRRWAGALDSSANRKVIEKSFDTEHLRVSTSRFVSADENRDEAPETDEFNEIETVLRENKYRQYVANGGQKPESETTEAIPVNFVGGYLAFYRTGHKIISASSIIEKDADKIDIKQPHELKLGEFIVVRESDRDLVREIADLILERSGMNEARELASKWKEALEIEQLFYTPEEIYERLKAAGCTRGFPSVHSWLTDEEMIAPQSKQDLEFIATITENAVLQEKLDDVYQAAGIVKNAHIQAGKDLSRELRERVVNALKAYGDIDPFNIWEPIEMQIDGIGTVRILKIIDIGAPVTVDKADTNRLISEE